jgi:hypothetical protein
VNAAYAEHPEDAGDVRAMLGLKPAGKEPDSREPHMSAIINAPTATNSATAAHAAEAKTAATVGAGREVMVTAGANATSAANTFEQRVTQETGTH